MTSRPLRCTSGLWWQEWQRAALCPPPNPMAASSHPSPCPPCSDASPAGPGPMAGRPAPSPKGLLWARGGGGSSAVTEIILDLINNHGPVHRVSSGASSSRRQQHIILYQTALPETKTVKLAIECKTQEGGFLMQVSTWSRKYVVFSSFHGF